MHSYICAYYFILQLIVAEQLNFQDLSSLNEAESKDQFPPRFKVKISWSNRSDNIKTLNLNYKICHKSPWKMDSYLSLNVFIPGYQPMHTIEPIDCYIGTYVHKDVRIYVVV